MYFQWWRMWPKLNGGKYFPECSIWPYASAKNNTKRFGLHCLHCQVLIFFPREIQKFISFLNSRKKQNEELASRSIFWNIFHIIPIQEGNSPEHNLYLVALQLCLTTAFCYVLDNMVFNSLTGEGWLYVPQQWAN